MFVSQLGIKVDSLLMTSSSSVKKQQLQLHEVESKLKYSFSDPNALEQHNRQCKIIENFKRDYLGTNLFPKYLIKFARYLRLAYNDYENIEYDHNYKDSKERIIHCITKRWFKRISS